jgi:inosine-uridine nucleoside N-ribohydrolase/formylmethanofuran dehydrogenase subunit E
MKKGFLFSIVCFSFIVSLAKPLPQEHKQHIIIDTDCAVDDFRAISLLLSLPEIEICGILVSEGTLLPEEGTKRVHALLQSFGADTIPVGMGKTSRGEVPAWRELNRGASWSALPFQEKKKVIEAEKLLTDLLNQEDEKITLVCMGPLTNIAGISPEITGRIYRIVWYVASSEPLQGFNYEYDRESADKVMRSGIRIDMISSLGKAPPFDISFYEVCQLSESPAAKAMQFYFSQPSIHSKLKENHFRLYDDLLAVYLTNPELFDMTRDLKKMNFRYNKDYNLYAVNEVIKDIIRGTYVHSHNIVFNRFPVDPQYYTYDIRQIIDSAIIKYGMDEWQAVVMTDEFHGHLGVFSILGAKMGITAREIFGVDHDMLEVVTYAGTTPPYSCMNDGIQVSTGATLGMGTIFVATDSITRPVAVFSYKGRSVEISLKPEYLTQVNQDISEGIVRYGLMDDGYWKMVRRNAIRYWLEWDRNVIFDVREMN